MDLTHIVLLLIGGVAGGAISALVGGAAIVTFPVLLATGISPMLATTSNMVALAPGNLFAALYDRSQLPPLGRSFALMVAASFVGSLIGASLLIFTPERVFALLVPLLLGCPQSPLAARDTAGEDSRALPRSSAARSRERGLVMVMFSSWSCFERKGGSPGAGLPPCSRSGLRRSLQAFRFSELASRFHS